MRDAGSVRTREGAHVGGDVEEEMDPSAVAGRREGRALLLLRSADETDEGEMARLRWGSVSFVRGGNTDVVMP